MSELLITVLSLVGGAVLASVSGIVVTCWVDKRKEKKELEGFKLEFKLAINHLCDRLDEFEEIYYSTDINKANEYISTRFIDSSIFYKYSLISSLSKVNIDLYYIMIKSLEEIDAFVGKPNPIHHHGICTVKEVCLDNPIWEKLYIFSSVDLKYLHELVELLR